MTFCLKNFKLIKNLKVTTSTFKNHFNYVRCIQIIPLRQNEQKSLNNSINDVNDALLPRKRAWNQQEVDKLKKAVAEHGKNWKYISEKYFQSIRNKSSLYCKWKSLEDIDLHKGMRKEWNQQELDILKNAVTKHGENWKYISENYFESNRNISSIRQRWKKLQSDVSRQRYSYYDIWTEKEDKILMDGVKKFGVGNWTKMKTLFSNKLANQITSRWRIISRKKRGTWTKEEVNKLLGLVDEFGRSWMKISSIMDRPYSHCRTKFEAVTSKPWSKDDNEKLREAYKKYGHDWNKIKDEFPGRYLHDIKSHFLRSPTLHQDVKTGRWNELEIMNFWIAFEKYKNQWIKVSKFIGTRTPIQCRQYYAKLKMRSRSGINLKSYNL